jgi:serine/threonine protein kinase
VPGSAPLPQSLGNVRAALAPRYEIVRELGEGAFATVYVAKDLRHDREVAIKVLREDSSSEIPEYRFIREIRVLASLQHPHILPLIDSGHVGASLYYVSPYVRGESLRQAIARERQLPIPIAVEIAREVADALHYAHSSGVIHRDIKPENILLSDWHAIVADFGIAQLAGGHPQLRKITHTRDGMPGTPAYMSPEQIFGAADLDLRADIYSLGCVLFEMLTGRSPFDSVVHLAQRLTSAPPSVRMLRQDVPEDVAAVVARSMAPNPRDRFQTAAECAKALRATDWHARGASTDGPVAAPIVESTHSNRSFRSTEADALYHRASEVVRRRVTSELPVASAHLSRAITLEPRFAAAHSSIGVIHLLRADLDQPVDAACTAALDAASRALDIDPKNAEAHAVRGLAATFLWDWKTANEAFALACAHGAESPIVQHWYGLYLCARGQLSAAASAIERAISLGGDGCTLHTTSGLIAYYARDFDAAAAAYHEAETADPTAVHVALLAGMAESARGDTDRAFRLYERGVDLAGRFGPLALTAYCCTLASSGRASEAARRRDELMALARRADVSPFYEAAVATAVGDFSAAIASLLRAEQRKDAWLLALAVHPWMDPLRNHQGYLEIVQEIGLVFPEDSCRRTPRH